MKAKVEGLLDPQQYTIKDDFKKALKDGGGKMLSSGLISVESGKDSKSGKMGKDGCSKNEKNQKDDSGNKCNKKRKL